MSTEPKKIKSTDVSRIQSHADRSGGNQGFKARAQRAAAKNGSQSGGAGQKAKKK